jgi:glutathione-independent formaldehyde dehydrogenase
MKAVVFNGPRDMVVKEVPDARIEEPNDVLVRVTSTNICGSDLHMYEGRTSLERGRIVGHENLGEVVECGAAVRCVQVGDRVCVPFNVACGYCRNCERGLTSACLTMNPGSAGAGYGYADMGPYEGGQAELLRVPYADFNCLRLPEDAAEKEQDYVMLADIFPTGFHATELAEVRPGETVAIYGGGPVGLLAAYSATLRGASQVMVVDRHPDRLKLAEEIGAIAVDDSKGSPVEQILELTHGEGADKGCECVGYQAHDIQGHEHPNMTLNSLVRSVRPTGLLGVVGVFVPEDPKAATEEAKQGRLAFDFGELWTRGQRIATGQAPVKAYNRYLCKMIQEGRARPSFLVSHELPLEDAPEAYQHFDARDSGWTKVILKPQQHVAREAHVATTRKASGKSAPKHAAHRH